MAEAKKSVKDLPASALKGKKVLIRCDLNVPLDGKTITDDTRIRASVETIKYLVDNGARVAVREPLGSPLRDCHCACQCPQQAQTQILRSPLCF